MKKFIFLLLTSAFVFALSSCDEQKQKRQQPQKERHERRW